MKIIKIGKLGYPTSREIICSQCDSILEVWSNEIIRLSDIQIGSGQIIKRKGIICPICGAEISISFDNPLI